VLLAEARRVGTWNVVVAVWLRLTRGASIGDIVLKSVMADKLAWCVIREGVDEGVKAVPRSGKFLEELLPGSCVLVTSSKVVEEGGTQWVEWTVAMASYTKNSANIWQLMQHRCCGRLRARGMESGKVWGGRFEPKIFAELARATQDVGAVVYGSAESLRAVIGEGPYVAPVE
jgi:hypothetical protein